MAFPINQYSFLLDVHAGITQPPIQVKQADTNSAVFNITLLNNYLPINLTGYSLRLSVAKPDGSAVFRDCTVTDALAGVVQVLLSEQTVVAVGTCHAEISIYDTDGNRISTFPFVFEVVESVDIVDLVESSNDLQALTYTIANAHAHANKPTLDKIPNNTSADNQKFLKAQIDGTLVWSGANVSVTIEVQEDAVKKGDAIAINFTDNLNVTYIDGVANVSVTEIASGDMTKAVYDANDNGKVDVAEIAEVVSDGANTTTALQILQAVDKATKVESSATNGYIKINNADTLVYSHPTSHPATMIVQDTNNRFASDTEKTYWNSKASGSHTHNMDTITEGTTYGKVSFVKMSEWNAKSVVSASATNGNVVINSVETVVYTHPTNHPATVITEDSTHRFVTDTEKSTWNGKSVVTGSATNGNIVLNSVETTVYTHPANHAPSIITQDSSNRFVTDAEKSTWNAKQSALPSTIGNANKALCVNGTADGYVYTDKADAVHTHDDRYYTETESNANFAPIVHNHDTVYMGINNAYTKTESDAKYAINTDMIQSPFGIQNASKAYYSNIAGATAKYVRLGTVAISSSFNRARLLYDVAFSGAGTKAGMLDIMIYHSTTYNTIDSQTYYNFYTPSGKDTFASGDLLVVTSDVGGVYTYEFWVLIPAFSKLYVNQLSAYKETATVVSLPVTVVQQDTAPSGATAISAGGVNLKQTISQAYSTATQGQATITVGISGFSTVTDTLFVLVNGSELYETVHWTVSGTTVTLLNAYTLDLNDQIALRVFKNSK